ncbi:MAG: M28 family peptidase [Myxococcales bacterium]|nr:M28 family peptidase [Myxococcales bacterium]
MNRSALLLCLVACTATPTDTQGESSEPGDTTAANSTTRVAPTTGEALTTTTGAATTDATTTGATTGDADPCTASPQALADCVDPQRWQDDIEFIADIRTPGSPHWQAVQDLCADRLTDAGFEVQLQDYGTGTNVVGRRLGAALPGEHVVISAHYDHIPDCLGADDNASGVAAALEVARVLALAEFDRTLIVGCWDEEELGLIGSEAYVAAAQAAGDTIVAVFNYDMIGYYDEAPDSQTVPPGFDLAFPDAYAELEATNFSGDFIAAVSDAESHAASLAFGAAADRIGMRKALLELPAGTEATDLFADLRRSDHAAFWDAGFPAIFLTDSGEFRNHNYHCMAGPDVVADLTPSFAVDVTRATVEASAITLGGL